MLHAEGPLRVRLTSRTGSSQGFLHDLEPKDPLHAFRRRFEALAAVLNEASHYGPNIRHEQEYAELRAWMLAHYGEFRRHLTPYLADDSLGGFLAHGDEFESLFGCPTLAELLRCDDGRLPARVRRAQDALSSYEAHLLALAQVT